MGDDIKFTIKAFDRFSKPFRKIENKITIPITIKTTFKINNTSTIFNLAPISPKSLPNYYTSAFYAIYHHQAG